MLLVEKDVYAAFQHELAGRLVAAYDRKKPSGENLSDAIDLLRAWNGQMEKQTAAPMVAELAYRELRKKIAESAAPRKIGSIRIPDGARRGGEDSRGRRPGLVSRSG